MDLRGLSSEHEDVVHVEDRASGLRAVIAIHSTRLGPAAGGIRRKAYASLQEAAEDALRLSAAMTAKCALAGLPAGGGKTVIVDRPGLDASAVYRALGRAIDGLGGRYVCGQDVGTSDLDLEEVRRETRHATPAHDTGTPTALGVLAALRGTLEALDGSPDVAGRTCLVQGLGSVGLRLARALVADGARVLATDVRPEAREAAAALGARIVPPGDALATPCDVFVPCALGGILTPESAARAPFRAVCGSANNQLAHPDAGRILHERGVLYAPDFVANAGGVIDGFLLYLLGDTAEAREEVAQKVAAIEETTRRVLAESARVGEPPEPVARRWAAERVRAAAAAPRP